MFWMLDPCFCSAHAYIRFNLSISTASQFRQRSYKWRRRVKASPTAARWLPTATVAVGALCRDGAACGGEGDRGPHPDFLFHLNFHHALLEAIGLQVSMPPLLFMPLHHFFVLICFLFCWETRSCCNGGELLAVVLADWGGRELCMNWCKQILSFLFFYCWLSVVCFDTCNMFYCVISVNYFKSF